jgi:hypothetical protein
LKYPALPEALALQMRKTLGWLKNHVQSVACWSPALLEQLIQDMDEDALWDFCYDLEGNPWLNAETLSWMALSERDSRYRPRHLRQIAAAHRNTPMDVLECLASDELPDVRAAVAANPNCTAALFAQMADDRHTGEWDLEKTCSNPSYPVAWLQESMGAMDTDALASLTLHPHCPEDVLLSLLRDHRKTSNYGWREGRALADIASRHPNLGCSSSLEVLQQFALDRFRSTTHSRAKRLALLSPHCPPALLKRHCNSLDWRERHAIASNPCTPRACLKQLQRDSNQHVRLAAASHTSSTH